jgi:transcriptional regulator with XRE-family HTH domain
MLVMARQYTNQVDRKYPLYLREWRESLSMTLDDVAAAVESNKGDVSKIERGVKRYNEDHLTRFADAFGIQPFQLFFPPDEQLLDSLIAGRDPAIRELAFRVVKAAIGEPETTQ